MTNCLFFFVRFLFKKKRPEWYVHARDKDSESYFISRILYYFYFYFYTAFSWFQNSGKYYFTYEDSRTVAGWNNRETRPVHRLSALRAAIVNVRSTKLFEQHHRVRIFLSTMQKNLINNNLIWKRFVNINTRILTRSLPFPLFLLLWSHKLAGLPISHVNLHAFQCPKFICFKSLAIRETNYKRGTLPPQLHTLAHTYVYVI